MLDIHRLKVFLAAAETGSFTRAAQSVHLSQPSVSEHIRALEQHFDTPLFTRAGRRLELTDAGCALVPLARDIVSASVRVQETMECLKGVVHGHLLVGCSTTSGKYVLPGLLAEFMRLHPQVSAMCHVTSRPMALKMLADGGVHLALSSRWENTPDLEFRKFISDPIVLAVPPGHPWASRDQIEPGELRQAPHILREAGSGNRTALDEGLPAVGLSVDQLRVVLTLGNSEAIALAVEEGIGVAFVSQLLVKKMMRGRIATVPVRGLSLSQDIFMVRQARHAATMAATAFWSFVREAAARRSMLLDSKSPG